MLNENITQLPVELWASILTFFSLKEMAKLSPTSSVVRRAAKECETDRIPKIDRRLYFWRDVPLKRTISIYEDVLINKNPQDLLESIDDEGLIANAAVGNLLHVVNTFLSIGADVNASNLYHYTAIIIAVKLGHLAIVQRLLKEDKLRDVPAFKTLSTRYYGDISNPANREIMELLREDPLKRFYPKSI